MGVTTTQTNKPFNPRGNDQSPLAFNRAKLFSGKALDFDGVNDSVNLDGFTMAGNVATIVFQAKFENDNYLLDLSPQRFVVRNRVAEGFQVYNNNEWEIYGSTNRDELGFYAIVSDGTTQRAYYNGVQLGNDATITALDWDSITEISLGSNHTGTNNFLHGQIAGFKIFNTALTAAQVADLYNNPEKVVPTGVDNTALKLWLPMQEGAGTTAYDGSGNGNHGTISGATYVHGIGAPVSQTAVIDWNKGTNIILESENPDNLPSFAARGFTKNSSTETSPIGTSDAHKYTENNTNSNPALVWSGDYSTGASQTLKVYLKADAATSVALSTQGQTSGGNINVTTEWQQFEVTQSVNATSGPHIGGFATITQGSGIVLYMWHPQMSYGESVYIPTLSTAQTSPVLLPQGITTGRDITGVNLFENVRKQGALNLDGNSWAEVHDNASLDFGAGSFSLEAWAKVAYKNTGSSYNSILTLGSGVSSANTSALSINLTFNVLAWYSGSASVSLPQTEGDWAHILGTYDGTNYTLYVNGSQVDQDARTAVDITNADVKMIGRDNGGSRYYQDQIAQPRIYNRALTAAEVLRNYNSGKNTYTND